MSLNAIGTGCALFIMFVHPSVTVHLSYWSITHDTGMVLPARFRQASSSLCASHRAQGTHQNPKSSGLRLPFIHLRIRAYRTAVACSHLRGVRDRRTEPEAARRVLGWYRRVSLCSLRRIRPHKHSRNINHWTDPMHN